MELLLPAFAERPLCPFAALPELADFSQASSHSRLIPCRKIHSVVSQGVQLPHRHAEAVALPSRSSSLRLGSAAQALR